DRQGSWHHVPRVHPPPGGQDHHGAEKVIVYGSVARGEATIHSDIDL
ncbi:MAG: nucleotidyltransferase family protein, partial [Candidatus Methylomirabilia bacterium]